jgi:hypothetical protein
VVFEFPFAYDDTLPYVDADHLATISAGVTAQQVIEPR